MRREPSKRADVNVAVRRSGEAIRQPWQSLFPFFSAGFRVISWRTSIHQFSDPVLLDKR
jgi:hypothetical protein